MCSSMHYHPFNLVFQKHLWSHYFIILLFTFLVTSIFMPRHHRFNLLLYMNENLDVQGFLVSEKYDGIRAIWKIGTLQTRQGKPIFAPNGLPPLCLICG